MMVHNRVGASKALVGDFKFCGVVGRHTQYTKHLHLDHVLSNLLVSKEWFEYEIKTIFQTSRALKNLNNRSKVRIFKYKQHHRITVVGSRLAR